MDWGEYFSNAANFLPGNNLQIKLATTALIIGKHCLIEDTPGKGKTLLAKYVGKNFDLQFKRIQGTNDLMPSDILGFHQWQGQATTPLFRPGPIFTDLFLVDEINRASPRTQSALLQAMEEKIISIDDQTYELSPYFCVLATQNPREHVGTAVLPESQMDRFLFKFSMGTVDFQEELQLLKTGSRHEQLITLKPLFSKEHLLKLRHQVAQISIDQTILEWITLFLQRSRQDNSINPLSSRSGLDFILSLKAWAIINQRKHIIIDDLVLLFPYCFAHRLYPSQNLSTQQAHQKAAQWLTSVQP